MGTSSEHFSTKELACHHCGVNGCGKRLVDALEALRALMTKVRGRETPVLIDSAFRCAIYNATLKNSVKHDQHVEGNAADVRVTGMSAAELYSFVIQIPVFKGIGRDDFHNYCHIDVRPDEARWCYSANGFETAWYDPQATKSMLS